MYYFYKAELHKIVRNKLFIFLHIAYLSVIGIVLNLKTADPNSLNYSPKTVTFSNMLLCNSLAFLVFSSIITFVIYSSTIMIERNNDTFKYMIMCYSKSDIILYKFLFCTFFIVFDFIIIVLISGIEGLVFNGNLSGISIKTIFMCFSVIFLNYLLYGLYAFLCSIITMKYSPVVLLFMLFYLRNNISSYISGIKNLFFSNYMDSITYNTFKPINYIPNNTVVCTIVPQNINITQSYIITCLMIVLGILIVWLYTKFVLFKVDL